MLAATRIAQALTAHGIAVLRFDFTRSWRQRRRLRQYQSLVQCGRPAGGGGYLPATSPRASPADRPLACERGHSKRRARHPRGRGG
ncbi:hypothetical protein ACU4GD_08280 [Cupriavidus basilensis]